MAVILAFILVLWAWGRFESFAICTGHGNGSKIDFLFDAYCVVARYPWAGGNRETSFQTAKVTTGLHNHHYQQQAKTMISKGFLKK